jgi:2-phospho-L-lactate guanylyltransferase (CobY/MobA/RfbA family)
MYEAIRTRVVKDTESLGKAIAAIESQADRPSELDQVLEDLRALQAEKTESLSAQGR